MMVMDNAGACLRELARRNVKLILHGHRHHQHFARIAVDPATAQSLEIAVLSAGTPTEGGGASSFRHGFNVIRVYADDRLEVEMFEAEPDGGTFCPVRRFDVVPLEQHARVQFERCRQGGALWCRRVVCIVEINDYGDAHVVREFRGVKTPRERVTEFPAAFPAKASSGMIEGYRAASLSEHGPGVTVQIEAEQPGSVSARVIFKGVGLQHGDDPVDLMTEFQANNAFALNRWQFESMYPVRRDYLETMSFRSPAGLAVEELVLHLRFPNATGLPMRLDLRSMDGDPGAELGTGRPSHTLVRLESQHIVEARIMHPVPNAVYQINWDLEETAPTVEDPAIEQAIGRSIALRAWLAGLDPVDLPADLVGLLTDCESWVREKLVKDSAPDSAPVRPLHFALFSYVQPARRLQVVVSNYDDTDLRRKSTYPFGLGLPGRAFKSADAAVFTRPFDWQSGRPLGYYSGDSATSSRPPQVPEVAMLAIPLAPPEAADWPYAVWQISTDYAGTRLHTADTATDKALEEVIAALQENLTEALWSIMQAPTQ
jgi:hypothetical protein